MANVYFKRGAQSALDAMSTYVEGAFYLTNDTNRLYFAQASNKLVDLNQYIHIISTRASLPTSSGSTLKEGDIYYVSSENILCIYKNGGWEQINPDTTLLPNQNAIVSVEGDSTTNSASIGLEIKDSKPVPNTATGDFTIIGGSNVHVSSSGNEITISADNDTTNTTYALQSTLQTTKGQLKLHNTSNTSDPDSTVDIVGDGVNVNVSSDANGTITITGNPGITAIGDGFDANGTYSIAISRTSGADLTTDGVTPTIEYGNTTKQTAVFVQGATGDPKASLSVYTKAEIDTLLNDRLSALDSLRYAGTVSQSDAASKIISAPLYGVGTVWKASTDIALDSPPVTAKKGDLIIAGGSNDSAVTWEVVDSGNDQLISLANSSADNSVTFMDSAYNRNAELGSIIIEGGQKNNQAANAAIEVNAAVSGTSNENMTFTVVHGAPGTGTAVTMPAASGTAIQTTGTALSIPVITGLTKDGQGHVTAVTAQTYQLTDTHAILQPISTSVEAANNTATVSQSFQLDSQVAQESSFSITSDNLKITESSGDIVINLEWETFS